MNGERPQDQHELGIRARHRYRGWQIDLDDTRWAEMMTALSIAIDYSDQDRAARLRTLRTALSLAERPEREE